MNTNKAIKLHFSGLTESQKKGLNELSAQLGIITADDGIPVHAVKSDCIFVRKNGSVIELGYSRPNEFYRALSQVRTVLDEDISVSEKSDFDMLCYMADMSRNAVYNIPSAKKMIRLLALCGYDSMMLYTEDTYELKGYDYFGYMRGRFTEAELREIDGYAEIFGIEVIPCIQTLAHLSSALRWEAFSDMVDCGDVLLVGSEKTYEFIDAMLDTCSRCFRSRRINIGMDEAHLLGKGKYKALHGSRPAKDIMLEHLTRVVALCEKYGYSPMIWSDMFFRMAFDGQYYVKSGSIPESITALVPPSVTLIYWDYYSTDRELFANMVKCHKQFHNPIAFAGGASKWYGFAPLNAFSVESSEMQLDVCSEYGLKNIIVTAWGDNGSEASQFSVLPSMLYFAEREYLPSPERAHMEKRALECFGINYSDLLLTDIPNNVNPVGDTEEKFFNAGTIINPCKYLLYNDPINGLADKNLDPATVSDAYRRNAERLRSVSYDSEWGYMFETLRALCDLLVNKSDLSYRIRAAYRANDTEALRNIAESEMPVITAKLDTFTEAFRRQWFIENKPYGFDIHEFRLGGLRMRLQSTEQRLKAYLDGKLERIDELEEEILYFVGNEKSENHYCHIYDTYSIMSAEKMYS